MSLLFTSLLAMLLVSCVLGVLGFGLERQFKALKHWPMFWAGLLLSSAAAPVMVFIQVLSPLQISEPVSHSPTGLAAKDLSWPALIDMPAFDWDSRLGSALVFIAAAIYFFILLALLARLVNGRLKAERIGNAGIDMTLDNGVVVRIVDEDCTPFALRQITKLGRAAIVLPEFLLRHADKKGLALVARHEQAHLARHDDELGLVLHFICVLAWPIPFVWQFLRRWREATEVHCDYAATRGASKKERQAYASTLINVHKYLGQAPRISVAPTLIDNPLRSELMRLELVLNARFPKTHRLKHKLVLVSFAALVAMVASTVVAPIAIAGESAKAVSADTNFDFVTEGRLSSRFGWVPGPGPEGTKRQHHGIDIAAELGSPLLAPAAGVVTLLTDSYKGKAAYGNVLVLQIDKRTQLMFAHLDRFDAKLGDRVRKGQRIAFIGNTGRSTGPHVHIEARVDGELVDPLPLVKSLQLAFSERWVSL